MLPPVGFLVGLVLLVGGWLAIGPWSLAVALVVVLVPATRRRVRSDRWALGGVVALVAAAVVAVAMVPDGRLPLPPGGGLLVTPSYDGRAAAPQPIGLAVPQHPGLAPNGRSSMHGDAWATDSYAWAGPLGRGRWGGAAGAGPGGDDGLVRPRGVRDAGVRRQDRLVALCGNRQGPVMHVLDPESMRPLATYDLPDREPSDKRPWEDLCGGAYLFLDAEGRAVVATTDRRVLTLDADLAKVAEVDLDEHVPDDDYLVALLPDWQGRTWYVTQDGRVGTTTGAAPLELGTEIANSIAADDTGVYVVTTEALVKVTADEGVVWQAPYANGGERKPGQLSAGSGTTPTVLPSGLVAIGGMVRVRDR